MGRLIDADRFKSRMLDEPTEWMTEEQLVQFRAMIDLAPTVDAVPVKHGRWIYHPDWQADGECGYECSACGMGSDVDYQFCMRCGAKMDGKDGDGDG